MKKVAKIIGVVFCFMFVIVLLQCDTGSKVTFNLDGKRNEGTYKITESLSFKQITITIKGSPRYIIFNIIDDNTISRRKNADQIFTKGK